nr:ionotropic receptor 75p.1 [Achelura yunnanensis]
MKCIYFLYVLSYIPIASSSRNVGDVLLSYVSMENKPTSLLAPELCWPRHTKLSLTRVLNSVGVNVAYSMRRSIKDQYLHHIIIAADFSCSSASDLVLKANEQGLFKSPHRWVFMNLPPQSSNVTILDKLDILIDSNVIVLQRVDEDSYLFHEVYKIAKGHKIITSLRAAWRSFDDMFHSVPLSFRRRNLRNHSLTMVNVITDSNDTKQHLHDRRFLHHDSISKMSYMVVRICFEMMNASENLLFTNTWGYRDKQGNWQGLIDHLLKKEADLGTLTIFTKERTEHIDYIAMVGSTAVRFVFREPPLAYVSNIFTLPFSGAVWFAILTCVLGCSLFLYITSKWEATMGSHPLQLDGSWADVLILIIGAVLQQGCTLEPRFTAGRCVTLLLFVSLTILYAAYSANIVVLLRAPSPSVRSLQDLLSSPLKLGASDFEYNRYFFRQLNDPIRKAIYDKKIAPKGKKPNFYNMTEGVAKIRQGLFAFHMELNPGYRLIQETYQEDEKCDLVEIDYINEIDPWLPGQKRSPYKDFFKINFMKIRESGIQACIHQRLHVPRPRCMGAVTTFSSVGIADMYPALLGTLYGVLLAPIVLLLEVSFKRLRTYQLIRVEKI